jgi:8-oxo-dGTP diphosphatase
MAQGLEVTGPKAPAPVDALTLPAFYFIRHAKAGSRSHWEQDDRLRPLSKSGIKQAEALVSVLAPHPIAAIFSSPYLRCVQTVEPLAQARRCAIKQTSSLAEGAGLKGAMRFIEDPKVGDSVLSTHGDVVQELVEELIRRRIVKPSQGGLDKGSTWVVEVEKGSPVRARYIPPP